MLADEKRCWGNPEAEKKIKNKEDMKLKMQYAEEALEVEEL